MSTLRNKRPRLPVQPGATLFAMDMVKESQSHHEPDITLRDTKTGRDGMSRLWFWMVGLTLFALTFTYEIGVQQRKLAEDGSAKAPSALARTEASRSKHVGAADMAGLTRLLRGARAGTGPAE